MSFEAGREGFVLTVEGRRLLRHSPRHPGIFLGTRPASGPSGNPGRPGRVTWEPMHGYRVVNRGPDTTVLVFGTALTLTFRMADGVFRMDFEPGDPAYSHLRIRLGAKPGERIHGCGDTPGKPDRKGGGFRLHRSGLIARGGEGARIAVRDTPIQDDDSDQETPPIRHCEPPASGADARKPRKSRFPVAAFVSDDRYWFFTDARGDVDLDFKSDFTVVEISGIPAGFAIGFSRTDAGCLAGLSREVGRQRTLPGWMHTGLVLDVHGGNRERTLVDGAGLFRADRGGRSAETAGWVRLAGSCDIDAVQEHSGTALLTVCPAGNGFRGHHSLGNEPRSDESRMDESRGDESRRDETREGAAPGQGALRCIISGLDTAGARSAGVVQAVPAPRPGKEGFLPAQVVPVLISMGYAGAGLVHAPAGMPGTDSDRDVEAFVRRAETACFSPMMRIGPLPEGWERDPMNREVVRLVVRAAEVHAALQPYHRETADAHVLDGLPAIRLPAFHYPGEAVLWTLTDQYMYGNDLLVAPAAEVGVRLRGLVLPDDRWVHFWTSRRFGGGPVSIDAPPGRPAVFFRESSPHAGLFDAIRRAVAWS